LEQSRALRHPDERVTLPTLSYQHATPMKRGQRLQLGINSNAIQIDAALLHHALGITAALEQPSVAGNRIEDGLRARQVSSAEVGNLLAQCLERRLRKRRSVRSPKQQPRNLLSRGHGFISMHSTRDVACQSLLRFALLRMLL